MLVANNSGNHEGCLRLDHSGWCFPGDGTKRSRAGELRGEREADVVSEGGGRDEAIDRQETQSLELPQEG